MDTYANTILIRPLDGNKGFLAYAIGLDSPAVEGRTQEAALAKLKALIADQSAKAPTGFDQCVDAA